MTKFTKSVLVIVAVVLVCMTFVGCQDYKWGPVGTTSTEDAINNGSLVVKQGEYIYYVNGQDDVSSIKTAYDNHFGKASVKGSIMKSKIGADGTLTETEVVVPKMFYTGNTKGGFSIFGEWLYYVSPSTQTDNKGNVLTSQLEYMRTKTDGTKTQSIAIVEGSSLSYVFTPTALIYLDGTNLKKVSYNAKKIGKTTTVAEEVNGSLFTAKSQVIFYTKASSDKTLANNVVYVMNGDSEPIELIGDKTYASGEKPTLAEQKTITLSKYDAEENVLYYGRKDNDSNALNGTYGYKFTDGFKPIDKTLEKRYSVNALTNFVPMGFEKGLLDVSTAKIKMYKPIGADANVDSTDKEVELSATPIYLFNDDTYLYYVISSKLARLNYGAEKPIEEIISDANISTSWIAPTKIDNFVYYIDASNYSYLARFDYTTYSVAEGKEVFPKCEIVSGYESSDKTSTGLVPKFMTQADKDAYIKANPVEEK